MHIHILGVCGTFMGGIARLAASSGHTVSGMDTNFYEPMASQLKASGIACQQGFTAELPTPTDCVIVGNVISRGNPSLEAILQTNSRLYSGPQWLAENVLAKQNKVIAVAGTHGKTTTTAMIIHILTEAGVNPGYLIGGVPHTGSSANLGAGDYFVIEADEYDTAFFDKRPKFIHYWADVYVVNNIEFDHVDIYPDLASIERQFSLLPRQLRAGGSLVVNAAAATITSVTAKQDWYTRLAFNSAQGLHWQGSDLYEAAQKLGSIANLVAGTHNHSNALAALAACKQVGIDYAQGLAALESFSLPARRLQVIFAQDDKVVIDDFAHHPTAIAATLTTVAELYPQARLLAALEPGSNTMKAGYWQEQLASSCQQADIVFALDAGLDWDLPQALAPLKTRGKEVYVTSDAAELQAEILEKIQTNDVLVFLSNGDFAGLRTSLPARLK